MASAHVDFERSDVDPRLIAKLGAGIGAFIIAVPLVMPLAYPQAEKQKPVQHPHIAASAVVLAVHPREDLARFEKADAEALDRYRWIDRKQGIVQIPIGRAMDLLVQRGLPGWAGPAPKNGAPP
jgi:hypothetical protein